jgi:glycosyltransferase involved in cell wall biosynthesis
MDASLAEKARLLRKSIRIDEGSAIILAVGRQEEQKALDVAVRAVRLLADRGLDVVLVIAGKPGGATERLNNTVDQLWAAPLVRVLGHREDVDVLMAMADVMIFPSRREGLGGAIIEAMAARLPIVCSDIPVLREVTEDGSGHVALFAPVGDAARFADALLQVLTNETLANQMVARAAQVFSERFTISKVAAQTAELYHRVVGQP